MELTRVNSSNVEAVGYIDGTRILLVQFRGGTIYAHPDVSVETYAALVAAPSKGQFVQMLPRGILLSGVGPEPRQPMPPVPMLTMDDMRKVAARKGEQPDCGVLILR